MIPEEDRGPEWLREYGFTNFGDIAADIDAMEQFALRLRADIEQNYLPHLTGVTDAMLTRLPEASAFPELSEFLTSHELAQDTTQANVYNFANGTNRFATAAESISADYRGVDAFAHARVRDVEKAFTQTPVPGEA